MALLKKDLDTQLSTKVKPLVLVPDTFLQRTPRFKHSQYDAPCPVSEKSFNVMASMVTATAINARFDYIEQPAYQIFDNELFRGQRRKFWKPLLKMKFPIYIVSPLFGIVWPGDNIGRYDLPMEDMFMNWRKRQLWRLVIELFDKNKCDCVLSYLPTLYDNVVRAEETPWFRYEPGMLLIHQQALLSIARKSCHRSAKLAKTKK